MQNSCSRVTFDDITDQSLHTSYQSSKDQSKALQFCLRKPYSAESCQLQTFQAESNVIYGTFHVVNLRRYSIKFSLNLIWFILLCKF